MFVFLRPFSTHILAMGAVAHMSSSACRTIVILHIFLFRVALGIHILFAASAVYAMAPPSPCQSTASQESVQESVIAGYAAQGDVVLSDRRVVKLSGLYIAERSRDLVRDLYPVGTPIRLYVWSSAPDRWQRLIGTFSRIPSPSEHLVISVHEELVSMGAALLDPAHGLPSLCLHELKYRENQAMMKKTGYWDNKDAVLDAHIPQDLFAQHGRFQVVEGHVTHVGIRRYHTYINFGDRWTHDFSVRIDVKIWKNLEDQGITRARLEGKRVRIRGVIEKGAAPQINLGSPDALDIVDAPTEQKP
jgi:hypothetical protein